MSENDVFDEDLMKELGLDPEDIAAVKNDVAEGKKKPAPPKPAPRAQQAPSPEAAPAEEDALDFDEAPSQKAPPPKPRPQRQVPPKPRAAAPKPPAKPTAPKQKLPKMEETNVPEYSDGMSQDIPVQLAGVLGKKSLTLRDVLQLQHGDVVNFKKQPQETIDLVANGKLVAKAELVMIDGAIGARVVKLMK